MERDPESKVREPAGAVVWAEAEAAVSEQAPADTVYVRNVAKETNIS
jgi:hypothetical protein